MIGSEYGLMETDLNCAPMLQATDTCALAGDALAGNWGWGFRVKVGMLG